MTRFTTARPPGSIPFQRPALPDVYVPDGQDEHEHQHFDEQEPHARPPPRTAGCPPEQNSSPTNKEPRLHVENDEHHRDQVKLTPHPPPPPPQHPPSPPHPTR